MPSTDRVKVGRIRKSELAEADRILRLAFGTFLGLPNPAEFMGDRDMLIARWHGPHVDVLAARQAGRLIGTNVVTQWGSFGFFGPLTILPEFWDRGVAQHLLQATEKIFVKKGLKRTGLFTFAASPKHVGLYQEVRVLAGVSDRVDGVYTESRYAAHWTRGGGGSSFDFDEKRARGSYCCLRATHGQDREGSRPKC